MDKRTQFIALLMMCAMSASLCLSAQDDDKPHTFQRPPSAYSRDTVNPNDRPTSFHSKKKFELEKLLIEPNVQFFFNNNSLQFGLMPSVGYEVYKNVYVGGSLNYNLYVSFHDPYNNYDKTTTQFYGGGPFIHYKIWKGFFARLRFEMLAVRYPTYNPLVYETRGTPYTWIGGGYNLTNSKNFFVPIALYFNPLYFATNNNFSYYQSPLYLQLTFYIYSIPVK